MYNSTYTNKNKKNKYRTPKSCNEQQQQHHTTDTTTSETKITSARPTTSLTTNVHHKPKRNKCILMLFALSERQLAFGRSRFHPMGGCLAPKTVTNFLVHQPIRALDTVDIDLFGQFHWSKCGRLKIFYVKNKNFLKKFLKLKKIVWCCNPIYNMS